MPNELRSLKYSIRIELHILFTWKGHTTNLKIMVKVLFIICRRTVEIFMNVDWNYMYLSENNVAINPLAPPK